jgi:hypothetical protein
MLTCDIMPAQITLRNVSPSLAKKLAALAKRKQQSLNATVLELLEEATGSSARSERLARYTNWSESDARDLDGAVAAARVVNPSEWK